MYFSVYIRILTEGHDDIGLKPIYQGQINKFGRFCSRRHHSLSFYDWCLDGMTPRTSSYSVDLTLCA